MRPAANGVKEGNNTKKKSQTVELSGEKDQTVPASFIAASVREWTWSFS